MVIEVGKLAGSSIIPYSQTTQRTKWIDISSGGENKVTAGTGTPTITEATIMFFSDSTGQYFMDFNIGGTCASAASLSVTLDDILTNITATAYPLVAFPATNNGYRSWIGINDNIISLATADNTTSFRVCNATPIPIQALPAYAVSYLEASTDASIYVEPASEGKSGLVDNSAGNVTGTPIKGKTDGVAVATGYVGETFSEFATTTLTTTPTAVVSKVVNKGVYLVGFSLQCFGDGVALGNIIGYLYDGASQIGPTCYHSVGTSSRVQVSAGPIPFTVTSDSTTISLYGYVGSSTGAGAPRHDLWIVRIA